MVKFHFTQWKLRKQPFFAKNLIGKCQISKSGVNAPTATLFEHPWVADWNYPHALQTMLFRDQSNKTIAIRCLYFSDDGFLCM